MHTRAGQVRVKVDQSWQQRGAAEIDDARAGRNGQIAPDCLNAVAADDDDGGRNRRAASSVDESCRPNDQQQRRRRRLRRGGDERRGGAGSNADNDQVLHGGAYNTLPCQLEPPSTNARCRCARA